jgi:hypothetical protein
LPELILIPFTPWNHLGFKLSLAIPGDIYLDLPNSLHCEVALIGTVAMIHISLTPFIGLSAEKMVELQLDHLGQICPNSLSNIYADHLKHLFRILLNLFENMALLSKYR